MEGNTILGIALIGYGGLILLDILVELPGLLRLPLFFIGAATRRSSVIRAIAFLIGLGFMAAGVIVLAGA
nr:D169 [uncultured bacterium]